MVILLKLYAVFGRKPLSQAITEGFERLSVMTRPWQTANRISMLNSLPATLTAVDAVVLDTALVCVELAPMSLGMPYIHVSVALHRDYSGSTPPYFYDWPHETTPAALARNRKGVESFLKILAPTIAVARAYAKRAGLDVDWDNPSATISNLAWITQTPREFDFESSHWPKEFHYTGPFHDGAGRVDVDFPWERLTGEPLIYASMGTMLDGLADVYSTIIAAAVKHKGVQLVFSVGDQLRFKTDRIPPEQNHPRRAGTAIGIAEARLGLHHPWRIEHCAGVVGSRRSSSCHPGYC
jgi:UDP:flavonoid glycosyltransferase YjiC (YdhE family)